MLAALLGRDLQRPARVAGGGEALWRADRPALGRALRVDAAQAGRVAAARTAFRAGRERAALEAAGTWHAGRPEAGYPARLGEIYDAPFGLFLRGRSEVLAPCRRRRASPSSALAGPRPSDSGWRTTWVATSRAAERLW
jgi:predicted Rossmann fold nucleotide-binding protein DprA/Smf involved in DNA uptake